MQLYEEISFLNKYALLLPGWDTAPYDLISPSKETLKSRIKTLSELSLSKTKHVVVTSLNSLLQKTIAADILTTHIKTIKTNDILNRESLIEFLVDNNYTRASTTNEPGEFSVRGSIIDIFINGEESGHRLDFFGAQVERIKKFDPESQTTTDTVEQITIIPSSELILSKKYVEEFKASMLNIAGSKISELDLIQNLSDGIKPNAIEQWLPLFYNSSSILEYLDRPIIIFDKFLEIGDRELFTKINNSYESRVKNSSIPQSILSPDHLWLSQKEFSSLIKEHHIINLELSTRDKQDYSLPITYIENFKITSQKTQTDKLDLLREYIKQQYQNKKNVIISTTSHGSLDRLGKIFNDHDIPHINTTTLPTTFHAHAHLLISPIEHSYSCPEYVFITETSIFGQSMQSIRKKTNRAKHLNELSSFSIGELVVHNEYGIGRFCGLETVSLSSTKHDCIKIEYASNNKLFIPVENINLITKYGGDGNNVELDSLGGGSWQIKKAKAKQKIKESAQYLMQIAAQRQLKTGEILEIDLGLYEEFCTSFPYVETEDQENAINDVITDLRSGRAMDRLICGDTGFGKTEVALRAAFIAIKAGKQVALICPTTLLAKQHFKLFKSRLEKFGIRTAQLSRLISAKESRETIQNLNEGRIDLVIGTHALLNDKIKFKDLGLLIIDEEQHFGVAQKEKLKLIKDNIHVLTLSATPIPRTLQMSLVGIKELSIISTSPVNRIPTKTLIMKFDELIIKDALLKEHQRNGQSFYICPRISDLSSIEEVLKRIAPSLKTKTVHGQMPPTQIDEIMTDFCDGKFDVLLSTSIIESGIDIPTANTLIVHKSDMFGLSQMYQIKGRIGRSNVESYAYFTFASNEAIKNTSLSKLEILQKTEHLGAGFSVASHDMDMRGYGNLVGEAQSGHIKEIGIELYQNMLTEEIQNIKAQGENLPPPPVKLTPQINLGLTVYIPETYIEDFDLRLSLYRRSGEISTEHELQSFAAEMVDRFGTLPEEFENLLDIINLRNLCYQAKILKLDASENGFAITFSELDEKQSEKLFKFVVSSKDKIQIKPDNKIVIMKPTNKENRSVVIEKFLASLTEL